MKKHFLIGSFFFVLIGLLLYNCNEDESIDWSSNNSTSLQNGNIHLDKDLNGIRVETIPFYISKHKNELEQKLEEFSNNQLNQGIASFSESENAHNSLLNGLHIIEDSVVYAEFGNKHTYTFSTWREFESDYLENLILRFDENSIDGEYEAFLIQYEKNEHNKFHKIFRLEDFEFTISPSSNSDSGNCLEFLESIEIISACGDPSCFTGIQIEVRIYNCLGGRPNIGEGPTGPDPNTNPSVGGNPNASSQNPDDIEIVTQPLELIPDIDRTTNCKILRKDTSNQEVKNNFYQLKNNVNGENEKGFSIYKTLQADPYLSPNPITEGSGNSWSPGEGNWLRKAAVHNHHKDNHIEVFSPPDIMLLLELLSVMLAFPNETTLTTEDLSLYLVTQQGYYAIKFADPIKTWNNFGKYYAANSPDFSEEFKKAVDRFYTKNKILKGNPKNKQIIGFLKLLDNYNMGLEFYETDSSLENWEELTLDENEQIKREPCTNSN